MSLPALAARVRAARDSITSSLLQPLAQGASTLDFRGGAGRLFPGTFTRSSPAWDGEKTVPANTPRIYGLDTKSPVVLIEGARTNHVPRSDLQNHTDTTVGSSSIVKATLSNGRPGVRWTQVGSDTVYLSFGGVAVTSGLAAGQVWTLSYWVRTSRAKFLKGGFTCTVDGVLYKLKTDHTAWVSQAGGNTTDEALEMCPASTPLDTWTRVQLVLPPLPAGTVTRLQVNSVYRNSFEGFTAEMTDAQFEQGGHATSLIPTTGSAATRQGDLWTANDVAAQLKPGRPLTLAVAARVPGVPAPLTYPALMFIGREGTLETFPLFIGPSAPYNVALDPRNAQGQASTGGLSHSLSTGVQSGASPTAGWGRVYIVYDGVSARMYLNGAQMSVRDPWGLAWTGHNQLSIGSNKGASHVNGHLGLGAPALGIPFLRPRALTAAEVAAEDALWAAELARVDLTRPSKLPTQGARAIYNFLRTNHLNWSDDLSNAAWTKSNVTVAVGVADPDGGTRAFTLTATAASAEFRQVVTARASRGVYALQVKGTAGQAVTVEFSSASPSYVYNRLTVTLTGGWQTVEVPQVFAEERAVFTANMYLNFAGVGATATSVSVYAPRLSLGVTTPLPYERTTDGQSVRDQSVTRNLLLNSQLAGPSLQAPSMWAVGSGVVNATPGDGTFTFTATARYGALFQNLTGLGGRPFTISAEKTGGNLLAYLYDAAGTYIANANAVTQVGNRWVVQVNRTDVHRIQLRVEDNSSAPWAPITVKEPMVEIGLTDGTYERSGNHGQLGATTGVDASDPTWAVQGLSLDGSDDRIVLPAGALPMVYTLSVAATAALTMTENRRLAGFSLAGTGNTVELFREGSTGRLVLRNSVSDVVNFVNAGTNGQWPLGTPVMLTVRHDRLTGRVDILINGALLGSVTQTNMINAAAGVNGNLGAAAGGSTLFQGVLHHASLHDRFLTDAEVAAAYADVKLTLAERGVTLP